MSQNFWVHIQMQSSMLFRVVCLDVVGTDETCDVSFYGTWGYMKKQVKNVGERK